MRSARPAFFVSVILSIPPAGLRRRGSLTSGSYPLSPAIRLHWLADGDHGFKPRVSSGRTERDNIEDGLHAIIAWLAALDRRMERDDPPL